MDEASRRYSSKAIEMHVFCKAKGMIIIVA